MLRLLDAKKIKTNLKKLLGSRKEKSFNRRNNNQKIKLFDKDFDLIFSIGEACSCSQCLRNSRLQFYSYPFDWLYGADFIARIKLLTSGMKDFINKEDLEYHSEERNINCIAYHNKRNDIVFNHDFKKGVPFDEMYQIVKEKYDRRSKRLYKQINSSENFLVVYIQTPNNTEKIDDATILKGYEMLGKGYMLYLFCDKGRSFENRKIVKLNPNVIVLMFDYDAYNKEFPHVVNFKLLKSVFDSLNIKNTHLTIKNKLQKYSYKLKKLVKK